MIAEARRAIGEVDAGPDRSIWINQIDRRLLLCLHHFIFKSSDAGISLKQSGHQPRRRIRHVLNCELVSRIGAGCAGASEIVGADADISQIRGRDGEFMVTGRDELADQRDIATDGL